MITHISSCISPVEHVRRHDLTKSSGRLVQFPDVDICKRPGILSSKFIGLLGRSDVPDVYSELTVGKEFSHEIYTYVIGIAKRPERPNVRRAISPTISSLLSRKLFVIMSTSVVSRPTFYDGVWFRSRLEAHWACFFDQANWKWDYEPLDIGDWTPSFRVEFPCSHSACADTHVLLIDVQPFDCLAAFAGHRCMDFSSGASLKLDGEEETIPADASAAFGINPDVTYWEMGHGAGGGIENVRNRTHTNADELWKAAGNIIRRFA